MKTLCDVNPVIPGNFPAITTNEKIRLPIKRSHRAISGSIVRLLMGMIFCGTVQAQSSDPVTDEPGPTSLSVLHPVPKPMPKEKPRWLCNYQIALQEAKFRNCPLLVVISDDRSVGFEVVWGEVYQSSEFRELSEECVVLAAFDGKAHIKETRSVDGVDRDWCLLFDGLCDDHQESHKWAHPKFVQREFWHPLQVFVEPAGFEITRLEGQETKFERLQDELEFAQEELGKPLSLSRYQKHLEKLETTVRSRIKKGHASVLNTLGAMKKRELPTPALKAYAEQLERALLREGQLELGDIRALIESGEVDKGKKQLADLIRRFRGYAPANDAKDLLKTLD